MSNRLGDQNAASAAQQSLLSLSNGGLATGNTPNAKDLINQYKNGLKELQDSTAKPSPTSSSSYTSLLEAAAKSGLKLPGGNQSGNKCGSPLTNLTGNGNSTNVGNKSANKLNKSLSSLPLSPVSPLSPFFQNQLLARNLANAANVTPTSVANQSQAMAAAAAAAAAAVNAQNKMNPLNQLYPNQLYNYQAAAAAAAAAAQFLPLQPLLQNGTGLMGAAGLGLAGGLPGALHNLQSSLPNFSSATMPGSTTSSMANGGLNSSRLTVSSPPLSGSAPNSASSTPNSNNTPPNNNSNAALLQQQQTALLQQQILGNALRSAAAAAAAAVTSNNGSNKNNQRAADGSEMYGVVPEQDGPMDLSVKQSPFEALALSQLCANYGGLFSSLAGISPLAGTTGTGLEALLPQGADCTSSFSPSSSNEENFASLQQLQAVTGSLPSSLGGKTALLNSLQLASAGLGPLSAAMFGRDTSEPTSEPEEELSSTNLPSGSETARSDVCADESSASDEAHGNNSDQLPKSSSKRNLSIKNNDLQQTLNSASGLLTLARLGALAGPQLQLLANAGLLGSLGQTALVTPSKNSTNAHFDLLKRLTELQTLNRSGTEVDDSSDSTPSKRKKINFGLESILEKTKDKNNNEPEAAATRRIYENGGKRTLAKKAKDSISEQEFNEEEDSTETEGETEGSSRRTLKRSFIDLKVEKRNSEQDDQVDDDENDEEDGEEHDTSNSLDRMKKMRRKRRKVSNAELSHTTDGDEADDEPEDEQPSQEMVKETDKRSKKLRGSKEVRSEEIPLGAFAVQEAH